MTLRRTGAVLDYLFLAVDPFQLPEKAAFLLLLTLATSFLGTQSYALAALAFALMSIDVFVEGRAQLQLSHELLIPSINRFCCKFFYYYYYFKEWKHTLAT